jgi:hypothetical protein
MDLQDVILTSFLWEGICVGLPEEELKKQVAAGEEGHASYRGFDPLIQYLLHRLDSMETNLRGEMTSLRQEMNARIDGLHQELHSTTRWIIGTVIAAAGVAVALVQMFK